MSKQTISYRYNKGNSFRQSFINTSELAKLHHLSNFLGGRCPEPPLPCPWLQYYYLLQHVLNCDYGL